MLKGNPGLCELELELELQNIKGEPSPHELELELQDVKGEPRFT